MSFRADTIALLYLTAGLAATMVLVLARDNAYFRPAQLAFAAALMMLSVSTNVVSVLIKQFVGNVGGLCLLWFLAYYLLMAAVYPVVDVSQDHLRYWYAYVIPGFLLGVVTFGRIDLAPLREFRQLSPGIRSGVAALGTAIAMLAYLLVAGISLISLFSIRRADIFLISAVYPDDDLALYQAFGAYVLLAHTVAVAIGFSQYLRTPATTRRFLGFVGVQSGLAMIAGTSLALMGSNKELVALVVMLALTVVYAKPPHWIFKGTKVRLRNAALLWVLGSAAAGLAVWHSASGFELPPLRIFGFEEGTSIFMSRSLLSRIEILVGPGVGQLSLSPILGDLGAEHRVGGAGTYIHSIISIQSHLGIVGTISLGGYFLDRFLRYYKADGAVTLKVVGPPILFVSAIATFFVWMPFWFLVGALFAPRLSPVARTAR